MNRVTTTKKPNGQLMALWLTVVVMGVLALPPQLSPTHEDVQAAVNISVRTPSAALPAQRYGRTAFAPTPWNIEVPDPWLTPHVPNRPTGKPPQIDLASNPSEAGGDARFHDIILKTSKRYQVDPALIKAIIMAESSYNPKAVSGKGAEGLMQLMPMTARELGVEDSFDPERNIDGGVRYYRKLLRYFEGDVALALAAYNAGLSKVKKYKGIPPYRQTRTYVKKVFEYYEHYKNQMASRVTVDG
jgi:soluble lytic murein transglycosylase-like protein